MRDELALLYGQPAGDVAFDRLAGLLAEQPRGPGRRHLTHGDVVLIAYPDHVQRGGSAPLRVLNDFASEHLADLVSTVHLLPFHPATSDDGFSITDYEAVDDRLGTWRDVLALGARFRLMFDFVLNHCSRSHPWFQAFLRDEPPYRDYCLVPPDGADLSTVRRPRATPLLTPFETSAGERLVWTTFSADQVDLDYTNPDVLLAMVRVLLMYIRRSAHIVRLDAIGFLWKRPGTESIHLPETHAVVRLLRNLVDVAAPDVRLLTETNVPHEENVAYLGEGNREAQLVYNFALPALLVHTLHTGDATTLTRWAATLRTPLPSATFFNVTATHDGIGLTPVSGILPPADVTAMIDRARRGGALVTYRTGPGGDEPYELNATYIDALSHPDEDERVRVDRLMVTQAIMLALKGVPGVYLPSLLGLGNWNEGAEGRDNRAINRRRLGYDEAHDMMRGTVFGRYAELLERRRSEPAFDPRAEQRILEVDPRVFAVERTARDGSSKVLALHNVSGEQVHDLAPYEVRWETTTA